MENNNKGMIIGVLTLIALGLGVWFMFKSNPSETPITQTTPLIESSEQVIVENTNDEVPAETSTVKSFEIRSGMMYFDPDTIQVNKGDTVRITLTNEDGMHDFVLDEFNVATEVLMAGQSETIEFVADQAGTFEYYCSVMDHRAMGMVGTLVVVDTEDSNAESQ